MKLETLEQIAHRLQESKLPKWKRPGLRPAPHVSFEDAVENILKYCENEGNYFMVTDGPTLALARVLNTTTAAAVLAANARYLQEVAK